MSYLEKAFPGRSVLVSRQRAADPIFDEICRDFELISADLTKFGAEVDERTGQIADTASTLAGLHEEIVQRLERSTN